MLYFSKLSVYDFSHSLKYIKDIPGVILLEYTIFEDTNRSKLLLSLKNGFSSLFMMRLELENMSDENRVLSLYRIRLSRLTLTIALTVKL